MGNYHIDIGKQLKARRLEQKREIKDIAIDTRVSEGYIEAIEEGRIEEFPSTVYYNLFARSYARELGFDPDQIFVITDAESAELERVEALGPRASEEEIRALSAPPPKSNTGLKVGLWIAVLAVIAIIVIYFVFRKNGSSKSSNEFHTEQAIDNRQPETTGSMATPSDESDSATPEAVETITPAEPPMKLRVNAVALSWILVMADGDTVLNRNLDSGSVRNLEADYDFLISAGNPNGLLFRLDNTPLKPISENGRPIRNVLINRQNKDQFVQTAAEGGSEEFGIGEP